MTIPEINASVPLAKVRLWPAPLLATSTWLVASALTRLLSHALRDAALRLAAIPLAAAIAVLAVLLLRRMLRSAASERTGVSARVRSMPGAVLLGAGLMLPCASLLDHAFASLASQGAWPEAPRYFLRQAPLASDQLANLLLLGVVITPWSEEWIFRGVVFGRLRQHAQAPAAIALSALSFALCHPSPLGFAQALGLGLVLGWVRERTGDVLPGIALHTTFNLQIALLAWLAPMGTDTALPEHAADLSLLLLAPALCVALLGTRLLKRDRTLGTSAPHALHVQDRLQDRHQAGAG